MVKLTDLPKAWESPKIYETGIKKFPQIVRFKIMRTIFYCAIDEKGKHWIRKSPLGIKGLTGCSNALMKELDK